MSSASSHGEFCKQFEAILKSDAKVAINQVYGDALKCMEDHNISYKLQTVAPQLFFTHPKNRGGLGLSWHNVHRNGRRIVDVGGRKDKLIDSVAFEMQHQGAERQLQVEFNSELIRRSNGLLANPSGSERYLTVGGGHTTAFCRAAKAGCTTSQPTLADSSGKLNLQQLYADPVLKEMIDCGWDWTIIPGDCMFCSIYNIPSN